MVYEIELRDRMVRVEEAFKAQGGELKAQRELIQTILTQMDKRFEEITKRLDGFMFWSLGITVTCAIFVVNFLK